MLPGPTRVPTTTPTPAEYRMSWTATLAWTEAMFSVGLVTFVTSSELLAPESLAAISVGVLGTKVGPVVRTVTLTPPVTGLGFPARSNWMAE